MLLISRNLGFAINKESVYNPLATLSLVFCQYRMEAAGFSSIFFIDRLLSGNLLLPFCLVVAYSSVNQSL